MKFFYDRMGPRSVFERGARRPDHRVERAGKTLRAADRAIAQPARRRPRAGYRRNLALNIRKLGGSPHQVELSTNISRAAPRKVISARDPCRRSRLRSQMQLLASMKRPGLGV